VFRPIYFTQLGWGFYCHGMIRFKHLFANISVGKNVYFGPRMTLDVPSEGQLSIGAGSAFTGDMVIAAQTSVTIGEDCLFSEMVSIRDANHGMAMDRPMAKQPMDAAAIVIGNNVWLGRGVIVLKGVTIGEGSVIGANSVVTHDIPANSIAVGSPAKVIRQRETIS
jgi:acetyltransferase-like isoleucine patch superfamily enzyme